jgi:hypothetical protein
VCILMCSSPSERTLSGASATSTRLPVGDVPPLLVTESDIVRTWLLADGSTITDRQPVTRFIECTHWEWRIVSPPALCYSCEPELRFFDSAI